MVATTFLNNYFVAKKADKMYPFLKEKNIAPLEKNEIYDIIKNVKALVVYKIGGIILESTDSIFISSIINVVTVGLYANYKIVVDVFRTIGSQVMNSIVASVGNLNAGDDTEKKEKVFNEMFYISGWFYGFATAGLCCFLSPLVSVWLGNKYVIGFDAVLAACVYFYISNMHYPCYTYRTTAGLFVFGKYVPMFSAIINIILDIVMGRLWGLAGILWASSIARIVTYELIDPIIVYPMSVLMNAGIRDILIISTPQDTPRFENLLGDGHQFGVNLTYAVQPSPDGLAQAFIIGADFIGADSVAMVLGDNIFAGHGLKKRLNAAVEKAENGKGATVFGYYVDDPERFGIVEFDKNGKAISIEEKPEHPKSNYCVTGLYFYDNRVVEFAKNLKPSARGELEITDLNRIYLEDGTLNVELLGQGFTWLDTGTHESLVDATNFVKTVEQHQHRKIACLEEIAYLNGWISKDELMEVYEVMKKNQYGQYLKDVMDGKYQEHLY